MALVAVQVELPQYSHSFSVQVPPTASILDIKREITQLCLGHPSVEGQRLISKGRVLADAETVEQLWKVGRPYRDFYSGNLTDSTVSG